MSELVEFEGLNNVRDLGGIATADGRCVRSGMLYRSDQLFFATDGDRRKLDCMGIATVVDFRSIPEREEKPDPAIDGARNVHLPIIEDVRMGITRSGSDDKNLVSMMMAGEVDNAVVDRHMQAMYCEFVAEPFAQGQYAHFIGEVVTTAEAGKASLWHCTAGKDRAGFATAIVLEALDVPREAIFTDYLQTNECLSRAVDALVDQFGARLPNDTARAALRRFFLADESYLQAAFNAIDERYGSPTAFYEQALGVDDAKRARMRELFLE